MKSGLTICFTHLYFILYSSQKILTSNKSYLYGNVRPWLGDGVLISKGKTLLIIGFWALVTWKTNAGKKWEERRKMIAPSFYFQLLNEQFQQTFHEKSKQLVDIIQENITDSEQADGAVLEMHSVFTKLTLEVLCGMIQRTYCYYLLGTCCSLCVLLFPQKLPC